MRKRTVTTVLLALMALVLTATAAMAQQDNLCHVDPTHPDCVDAQPDDEAPDDEAPQDQEPDAVEDEVDDEEVMDVTALPSEPEAERVLAVTGTEIATISLIGVALLAAGAGLTFAARRRSSTES